MAEYVVWSTLTDPEWNNTTVIDTDPVAAIEKLKNGPGNNIVQYGFGQLTHALPEHGLTQLELDTVTKLDSGIVILSYQVR